MTLKDILKRLIDLDLSPPSLAAEIGISRQMLNQVLRRELSTPWVRRAVAARLGFTYVAMWGVPDPGTARGERERRKTVDLHSSSVPQNSAARP